MRISEEKNIINKPTRCNMEMNQDTLEKMLGMNLKGMYYAFKTSLETHRTESMTTDQFVSWLVSSEWDDRRNRAVERAIRQASFRYKATIEEIDFSVERGLDKNLTQRLADLTFVRGNVKTCLLPEVPEQEKVIWQLLMASRLARKDIKYYTPIHLDLWGCLRLPRQKVQSCKNSKKSRGWICLYWMILAYNPSIPKGG